MPNFLDVAIPLSEVWVHTGNGYGSSGTKIRRFTTAQVNTGTAITYADSASNGASFTINENGFYAITLGDSTATAINGVYGPTKNASSLTTNIGSLTLGEYLNVAPLTGLQSWSTASIVLRLSAGDVIRHHVGGTAPDGGTTTTFLRIIKIGN